MPAAIHTALMFLINTLFNLYLMVLMIRIILVYARSHYFDPLTQLIVKLTNPVVKPLRRFLPNAGRFELSSITILLILEIVKFFLIIALNLGLPHLFGLIILALGDALKLVIQTFFYAILLQALLSWIQPMSPMNQILYQITSPIMRPLQRLIPPISGFDISPIPAIIILQLMLIMFVEPMMNVGSSMAAGLS